MPARNPAGFWIQAWIFCPSKLAYSNSSGGVISSSAKSLAFSEVSRSGDPEPGWTRKRSPGSVAVAASTARREPSAEAVNAITSWSARVRFVTLPDATSIDTRLARPRSAATSMIAF